MEGTSRKPSGGVTFDDVSVNGTQGKATRRW
jgi:hypothetical protein